MEREGGVGVAVHERDPDRGIQDPRQRPSEDDEQEAAHHVRRTRAPAAAPRPRHAEAGKHRQLERPDARDLAGHDLDRIVGEGDPCALGQGLKDRQQTAASVGRAEAEREALATHLVARDELGIRKSGDHPRPANSA